MVRKLLLSILIAFTSFFIYQISSSKLPYLDRLAENYFSETTSEAALAYATVRGVNAVVSVLKESQVEFSPAGVGINIAAGQVLDPIDDMTERLSSVIVTAIVSLGLQKLIMELGELVPLKCAAFIFSLTIIAIWLPSGKFALMSILLRICTLLFILRLILPFSSLVNDNLYKYLFKDSISESEKQLSLISQNYDQLNNLDIDKNNGFLPYFTQGPKEKFLQVKKLFSLISTNVDTIITALLDLTIFYISLFILQVIIIPIGILWLMILLVNTLFRSRIFLMAVDIRRIVFDKAEEKKLSRMID